MSRFFCRCPRNWTDHNLDVEKLLRLARLEISETKRPAPRRGASAEFGPDTSAVGLLYRRVRVRTVKRYSGTQRSRRRRRATRTPVVPGHGETVHGHIAIEYCYYYYYPTIITRSSENSTRSTSRGVYFDRQNNSWSGDTNTVELC